MEFRQFPEGFVFTFAQEQRILAATEVATFEGEQSLSALASHIAWERARKGVEDALAEMDEHFVCDNYFPSGDCGCHWCSKKLQIRRSHEIRART